MSYFHHFSSFVFYTIFGGTIRLILPFHYADAALYGLFCFKQLKKFSKKLWWIDSQDVFVYFQFSWLNIEWNGKCYGSWTKMDIFDIYHEKKTILNTSWSWKHFQTKHYFDLTKLWAGAWWTFWNLRDEERLRSWTSGLRLSTL